MARVRSGKVPWRKIDDLHRLILDGILEDFFDWNHSNQNRVLLRVVKVPGQLGPYYLNFNFSKGIS